MVSHNRLDTGGTPARGRGGLSNVSRPTLFRIYTCVVDQSPEEQEKEEGWVMMVGHGAGF